MKATGLGALPSFALLGPGFDSEGRWTLVTPLRPHAQGGLWFAAYETAGVEAQRFGGPAHHVEPELPAAAPLAVTLHDTGFEAGVRQVRERIAAGDVYQVNLTTRATVGGERVTGPEGGAHLLAALCRRGLPRFATWVRLPEGPEFVSASPELLFEQAGRVVRAEPMKGTAPAGEQARLEASEKDAAELAMITDLLRDDLHHVCARGTVAVPHARRYLALPYAVQAVSDVTGTLREGVDTAAVLAQLHPGGSITGAPRPAAQAIITALEATPRGAYCGTLGWQDAAGTTRFALLIRTASRQATGPWTYGVGGGITWDSSPEGELAEVHVKLGALVDGAPPPRPPPGPPRGGEE